MYRIEVLSRDGIWEDTVGDPNANQFATADEAEAAIDRLRALGDGWEDAEFRVTAIDEA